MMECGSSVDLNQLLHAWNPLRKHLKSAFDAIDSTDKFWISSREKYIP